MKTKFYIKIVDLTSWIKTKNYIKFIDLNDI